MMRFYAACLASYSSGVLHGRWVDAQPDADAMQEEIGAMLRESRFPNVMVTDPDTGKDVPSAEEWAVHDMEELPSWFGENTGLNEIAAFVELVEEHMHIEPEDMAAIVGNFSDVEEAGTALNDRFAGVYESFRHYAEEAADEALENAGKADSILAQYFDYEAYARDLRMDMSVVDLDRGVAIFYA